MTSQIQTLEVGPSLERSVWMDEPNKRQPDFSHWKQPSSSCVPSLFFVQHFCRVYQPRCLRPSEDCREVFDYGGRGEDGGKVEKKNWNLDQIVDLGCGQVLEGTFQQSSPADCWPVGSSSRQSEKSELSKPFTRPSTRPDLLLAVRSTSRFISQTFFSCWTWQEAKTCRSFGFALSVLYFFLSFLVFSSMQWFF